MMIRVCELQMRATVRYDRHSDSTPRARIPEYSRGHRVRVGVALGTFLHLRGGFMGRRGWEFLDGSLCFLNLFHWHAARRGAR